MAVTLGNGNITFGDGTVQSTRPTLLGGSQATGYLGQNIRGTVNYSASEVTYAVPTSWIGPTLNFGLSPSTMVLGGFGWYRSANVDTTGDSTVDAGTIQVRVYYRTIGSA